MFVNDESDHLFSSIPISEIITLNKVESNLFEIEQANVQKQDFLGDNLIKNKKWTP